MDFGDFINCLFGDLQQFLNSIVALIQKLFTVLVQVFAFIWKGLQTVADYALKGLEKVAGFFKHLWEGFFKKIFTGIVDVLRKVHNWLEAHLRPIINWLKKAQVWLERHVWAPLRQYIQFLQRIRRYLAVLKLLHIKWADALDRRLSRTEQELAHVFLLARGVINQVLTWINAASDPLRLGRMIMVAAGGRRMAAALVRIYTGLPIGIFFPHTGTGSHLYEQNMVSAKDINDPRRNPSASAILLGLSPVPIDGFTSDDPTPDDSQIDQLETVPYFTDYADYLLLSEALFDGLDTPRISITDTIVEQKGNLADAGKVIRDFLNNAVTV
jgi:hypothetical protein